MGAVLVRGWVILGMVLALYTGLLSVADSQAVDVAAEATVVAEAPVVLEGAQVQVSEPTALQFSASQEVTCTGGTVRVSSSGFDSAPYIYQLGSLGQCDGEDRPGCAAIPSVFLTVDGVRAPGLIGLADTVLAGLLSADELNAAETTTYSFTTCVTFRLVDPTYVNEDCPQSPQICAQPNVTEIARTVGT